MKKTLIIFIIILVALFIGLTVADRKSEYVAEKYLWKINKEFNMVTRDVENIPENSLNKLLIDYEKFLNKFPGSKLSAQAMLFIGRTYVYKKEPEKARQEFEKIIQKFSEQPAVVVQALQEIIHTYRLENDIVNVLKSYERAIEHYPLTSLGLEAPLLIAKLHKKYKDPREKEAFDRAIEHYQKIIQEHPDSLIEYKTQRLLAAAYLGKKEWRQAVNAYGEVLVRFSEPNYLTPVKADVLTKSINTLSVFQLKDFDLPVSIYKKFIKAHPEHPLNNRLQEIIRQLGEIKEKNQ